MQTPKLDATFGAFYQNIEHEVALANFLLLTTPTGASIDGMKTQIKLAYLATAMVLTVGQLPARAHYDPEEHRSLTHGHKHSSAKLKQQRTHKRAKSSNTATPAAAMDPWKLLKFAISPAYAYSGRVSIALQGPFRVIKSNGIPNHATGAFPNEGNPNTISEQSYDYRVPKEPQLTGMSTPLGMNVFGVAINGVPFDPGAAEWWQNNPRSGWQYEAMYLGARLGLDQNNAHVQPNGAYHYHGIPTGLLQRLAAVGKPVLIGYAADGFPIYGPFGFKNPLDQSSGLKKLKSSYRLKTANRPSNPGPGGRPDGSFIEDYEYQKGLGDLDDCNGIFAATPEHPKGIYHYVVTDTYPFIPRGYKGTPDDSFKKRRDTGPGNGPGPGFGGGPNGRPGGRPPGRDGRGPGPDGRGSGRRNTPWGQQSDDDDQRPPMGPPGGGPPNGGPNGGEPLNGGPLNGPPRS